MFTGKSKLAIDEVGAVVLEEDGTEVDDEDYFQLLKPNTTFILLRPHEVWRPVRDNLGMFGQCSPETHD